MSKAKLLQSLLGEIAPKAAAPAAGAGLMFPSDEAEALPVAAFKSGVQHPAAQLRKLVQKNKQNGVSPEKTVTDWIHKNTNYEHIGKVGRQTEGMGGDWYKGQIDELYKMILDGADKDTINGLDAWKGSRVSRDSSHVMPHVAAAATAATAAGGANAEDWAPLRTNQSPAPEYNPRSPQEAGFPSFESYEPEPSMWEKAGGAILGSLGTALEPWMEGGAIAESPIGKRVYSNVGEVMDLTEIPARAAHGVIRGGYGLLNGESPRQALNEGVDTYNSTMDENGQRFSDWVGTQGGTEWDKTAAYWGTQLADPTNLLGLGLVKGAAKGLAR